MDGSRVPGSSLLSSWLMLWRAPKGAHAKTTPASYASYTMTLNLLDGTEVMRDK
jgi:hypothetical protein